MPDPRSYHRWILWQYLHQYEVIPALYEELEARGSAQMLAAIDATGCLGFTFARVEASGSVAATVHGNGEVGVGVAVIDQDNEIILASASGTGRASVALDLPAGGRVFLIAANLEPGLDTCDQHQLLTLGVDATAGWACPPANAE
jgi:hypothetical protein